jgi:hypothetical protein
MTIVSPLQGPFAGTDDYGTDVAGQLGPNIAISAAGATVVGSYSTDGGQDWTTVGTETLATTASLGNDGLGEPLDLGVFHSSGSEEPTTADFSDLFITP